jgi:rare lipoprotein A (peptidoglycan hydrolase)
MNFPGFLGILASIGNLFFFTSSPLLVGNLPQQPSRETSVVRNSSLAIASRSVHSVKFVTLSKLAGFAGKRYTLSATPKMVLTPRDWWQTLLDGFTRPQLAVQPIGQKFQVQLKGRVVAEVPFQDQADLMVWQLQQMTLDPDFDPKNLHPSLLNATPVVKVKDEVLFWGDRRLMPLAQQNVELTAIAWVNNLRTALNVPKLSLVEAQSKMHALVPTNQHLKGTASWYGPYFNGRPTATGEIFNQNDLTAAHPSLPLGTYLKVTNLLTGNRVIVRINDRGPYWGDRSLDLSRQAAVCLNSELKGVVPYEAIVMQPTSTLTSATSEPPKQRNGQKLVAQKLLAELSQPIPTQSEQ